MRPIVPDPFPAQKHPWVHRCHSCGTKMVDNIEGHGIHCPHCHPKSYDTQLSLADA